MPPPASIASRAVRGAAWTIFTGIGSRALGLVGTVVLTYYLNKDVLGEVSDASVVLLLANQFTTIGVGQYLIAKPKSGPDVAWHATVFHLTLGVVAIVACLLLMQPLGAWMKAPALPMYLPGLALSVVFDRITFIPERLLARDMSFRAIGVSRTIGEITYTATSVTLAVLGIGGMAVVYANIARSLLRMLLIVRAAKRSDWLTPSPFSGKTFREMMTFGVPFSIGASAGLASRRFDNVLMSSLFGAETVGVYNLAYNVADVPAVQVGEQIGDVLLPSFAHMDHEQRKAALVRSTGLLALIVFPLAVGLGVVAPTLVRAILKRDWWDDVGPMLMVLSALSVTRPVGWTISSYLQARNKPFAVMGLEVFKLIALVAFMLVLGLAGNAHDTAEGTHVAPLWACAGVGVAFAAHAVASLWVVHRLDAISFAKLVWQNIPPLLACVPMVGAVLGVRYAMQALEIEVRFVPLLVELLAGAIAYVLSALVVARATARDFLGLLRGAARKRKKAEGAA